MSDANTPSNSTNVALNFTPPPHYVEVAIDGHTYLVPEFFVDVARLQAAHAASVEQRMAQVPYTIPSTAPARPYINVAEDMIPIPPEPPISEREALILDDKVKAMCIRHGITYKDAASRLYFMEIAAMDAHYEAMRGLDAISQRIRTVIHNEIVNPILTLDAMSPHQVNVQPGGTLNLDLSQTVRSNYPNTTEREDEVE